ncbi:MAG TPA: Ig-like domain-containing protein, partial [Vulgatibacter sp.]
MKRAVLLFGLSIAVLAGCGEKGDSGGTVTSGNVDPRNSVVEADRMEGAIADGSDAIEIRIVAKDDGGNPTKDRPIELQSTVGSDVFDVGAGKTDSSGSATVRLTAVQAGIRTVSVKVDGIRLEATGQRLTLSFSAGPGKKLAFVVPPSDGKVGVPLVPAVKIEILDAQGNRTSGTNEVTLKVESGDDVQTVSAVDGVATFAAFRISKPAKNHKLVATAEGLEGITSRSINVTPGEPAQLTFEQEPPDSVVAGQPIRLKVAVRDSMGNIIDNGPGSEAEIGVGLYSNPTGGRLEGVVLVKAAEGIATFDDVRLVRYGSGYSIGAFAVKTAAYQTIESQSFEVRPAAPAQDASSLSLAPTISVANGRSEVKIGLKLADTFGNEVANQAVQLRVTGTGNGIKPSADLFTNAVGRVDAVLTTTVAEQKTVTAHVVGMFDMEGFVRFDAGDASADTSSFTADVESAVANGVDTIAFELELRDAQGNAIAGQAALVSATGSSNVWADPGASVLTDEEGHATFVLSSIKAETKTVTVSVAGLLLSQDVVFQAGRPDKDKSKIEAGNGQTGVVRTELANPLRVKIFDSHSNPVPNATVTFTVLTGLGTLDGATLTSKDVTTGEDGMAEVRWTVGRDAGTGLNTVSAAADWVPKNDGTTPPPFLFTANTRAGAPSRMELYPLTNRTVSAVVGTSIPTASRVGVIVFDQHSNPVGSVPIRFRVVSQPPGPTGNAAADITQTNVPTLASGTTLGVATPALQRISQKAGLNVFSAECVDTIIPNPCGTLGS